jgi:DNA ligase 1
MLLATLVDVSRRVAATRSRREKRAHLAELLRQLHPDEARVAVAYLTGALPQGRIGLGPAVLRRLAGGPPADRMTLTLAEVDAVFADVLAMRGTGSQQARSDRLSNLFARATAPERDFVTRLILGEMRQGALEGVLVEALADAAELPAAAVRRAVMLAGDPGAVAEALRREGRSGLAGFRLEPLRPVLPMLAEAAEDLDQAMAQLGTAALEYKLDGARVQVHKQADEIRIFSRGQHDVTARLPEVVEAVARLPARSLIADGEAIALRGDGRPHPFQVTMRRFGRKREAGDLLEQLPLHVYLFDCLLSDGEPLLDEPAADRFARLRDATGAALLVPRLVTADVAAASRFLADALDAGHEGVMAKSLTAPYAAGNRGAHWLKVKQAHSLDLVVLAAEWGNGRRQGWLSNLHLGARDPATGGFVMLGKTFKGLTDRMLEWQTRRLLALEAGRSGHVVHVHPELVVEIAVNEIQRSPQYPAGLALRFARVKRYREDKRPEEADTVATVRALYGGAIQGEPD